MGFELEHFTVVRGGEPAFGQFGIDGFHPPAATFDGIISGPPCQPFSKARNGRESPSIYEDMLPEVERVIGEALPSWWLIEEVDRAPIPHVEGYYEDSRILWAWDLGVRQRRPRRFTIGFREPHMILWPSGERAKDPLPTVGAKGMWSSSAMVRGIGLWKHLARRETLWPEFLEAFGLPDEWDAPYLLRESIRKALGNAVPLPVARTLARTIRIASGETVQEHIKDHPRRGSTRRGVLPKRRGLQNGESCHPLTH